MSANHPSHLPKFGGMTVPPLPDPATTDPVQLGLMQGSPPPPDKCVTFANFSDYPNPRWAFHHMRQLAPTLPVWRGAGERSRFDEAPVDLHGVSFAYEGQKLSVAGWCDTTYTDALLVLHRGRIVSERYLAGMQPRDAHLCWSVTKSFVGVLGMLAIHDGLLDPAAPIGRILPELAGTAWEHATVQQTMDMTTGVRYSEIYGDPTSAVVLYALAGGLRPMPHGYPGPDHLYAFLKTLAPEGEHGAGFHYKTVHTEVLGWLLSRVTGKSVATLMSERLWQPLGAEEHGLLLVDRIGTPVAGAGLNATLRDLARFGEMMRRGGSFHGQQIVPTVLIEDLARGADQEKFKASEYVERFGYSYHNQWWVAHDADGTYEAKGIHGQHIHINPAAEVVIVKFSSHPVSTTLFTHDVDRAAFAAIAGALR